MKRLVFALFCMVLVACLVAADTYARGGRGGGARGGAGMGGGGGRGGAGIGGGGGRGGGFPSSAGMSGQPSRGFSGGGQRSPSGPGVSRPSTGRPNAARPNTRPGGATRPGTESRPGTGARPGATQRPATGARPGAGRGPGVGAATRPGEGRPSHGQVQDFLDLPSQPATRPAPGGSAARPGSGARPADRPLDRPGAGDRRPGDRPGVGDRPGRPVDRPGSPGARPGLGDDVRDRWRNPQNRPFDSDWYGRHPGHGRWNQNWARRPAVWAWTPATWGAVGAWFPSWGWSEPIYFDFGGAITVSDGYVYDDGQQIASTEDYAQQAYDLAVSVPEEIDEDEVEWMPLGVFALAEKDVADTGMLMQLAVSKEGIIAGTYYNETTGSSRPLEGMVDRKTQKAAWRFADQNRQDVVLETGIYNLTQDETTVLAHFGLDKTQTWAMYRLPEPDDAQTAGQ